MSSGTLVRLEDLWVGFRRPEGTRFVFRGAKMEIRQGDLACLLGPSGTGKSVLLNLLIGSLRPGRGSLVLKGGLDVMGERVAERYPPSLTKRMGIVFQESALFEDLSPLENAAFGLRGSPMKRKEKTAKVEALLRDVDLRDPPARIHELSGGQKKRLALARTLATEPEFLIFDEPTSGLDPLLCRQIADLIQRTHAAGNGKRTTLVVTHDYEAVVPIASRVFVINPSSGTIEELEKGQDPGERMEAAPSPQPGFEKEGKGSRLLSYLRSLVEAPLGWLGPMARFLSHPWPGSWRQTVLRVTDALVLPSLYVCAAGAVLGGLATFFALENNPLKGAMDRQALIGLGKVVAAIVVPLMTAVLFAARVGAGAAARLGNIRLGRQDDALRMLGTDPGGYLVTPLFWSCLVGLPLLAVPVGVAACLSSLFFACGTRPITPFGWSSAFFTELTFGDLSFALIKLVGSGGIVAAVTVFFGLKPKSGAEDLGRDVTSTIVASTFLVILWHGLLTFIQYGITG